MNAGAIRGLLQVQRPLDAALTKFVLNDFLPYQLAILAARVSREFSTLYKAKFGITIPEWRVVAHLSQTGGPLSVGEISDRVDMDKSKVSRAVGRLETAGHVEKSVNTDDRRLVKVRLTDQGRQMIAELAPLARQFETDVLHRLGPDAPQFRASLGALIDKT